MKVGDLVEIYPRFNKNPKQTGIIVGFNKKGEGEKILFTYFVMVKLKYLWIQLVNRLTSI